MSVPPKVSRELADAVQEDALRAARDEAKHRAVRQMEGYDVFKNMVSVALGGSSGSPSSRRDARVLRVFWCASYAILPALFLFFRKAGVAHICLASGRRPFV